MGNSGIKYGQKFKDDPVYNRPVKLSGPLHDAMAEIHGNVVDIPQTVDIDGKQWAVTKRVRTDLPAPQLIGYRRTHFNWIHPHEIHNH